MDELTRQAILVHKAILEKLIRRITALERLLYPDDREHFFEGTDAEGNGAGPSEHTDDEKTRFYVKPGGVLTRLPRSSGDAEGERPP